MIFDITFNLFLECYVVVVYELNFLVANPDHPTDLHQGITVKKDVTNVVNEVIMQEIVRVLGVDLGKYFIYIKVFNLFLKCIKIFHTKIYISEIFRSHLKF